jgi:hypothetical protein
MICIEQRLELTERREQYDTARSLADHGRCPHLPVIAAFLLRDRSPSLSFGAREFLLKRACELHCHTRSKAIADNEDVVGRSAVRAEPVPRRAGVKREARLTRGTRGVRKAAIVQRKHVRP